MTGESAADARFSGRTVIVTGATGHLGRAVAQAFAGLDANLVLLDRIHERLPRAFGPETDGRLLLAADLSSADDTQRAVTTAVERFGRIDVLCNIAGGFRAAEAVHETTDEALDFLFNVNARTLLHAV